MKEKDLNRSKLFVWYVFLEETCYVKRKHMQIKIHHGRDQVKRKKEMVSHALSLHPSLCNSNASYRQPHGSGNYLSLRAAAFIPQMKHFTAA